MSGPDRRRAVDAAVVLLPERSAARMDESLWTHWPSSGKGSGMKSAATPWLAGVPARRRPRCGKVPAAEMAIHPIRIVRVELDGVAAHAARARVPTCHGWDGGRAPSTVSHVPPESSRERERPARRPSQRRPFSPSRPASTCQVFSSVSPLSSGSRAPRRASTSRPGPPSGGRRAVDEAVRRRVDRAVARIVHGVEDLPALQERAGHLPSRRPRPERTKRPFRVPTRSAGHQSPGPDPVPTIVKRSVATAGTTVPKG